MASGPAELQSGDDAELDELLDSKVKIKIPTVKPNKHWHFRALSFSCMWEMTLSSSDAVVVLGEVAVKLK